MPLVTLKCHRCRAVFQREQSRTSAARGRVHDYCSRACHRAAEALLAAAKRQAREKVADAPREPYKRGAHQRFAFTPSERARVMDSPPVAMAREGRDVEQARPAPEKCEIPARLMPSVRVF